MRREASARWDESLRAAAKAGDLLALEQALAAGADVNAQDVFGCTALSLAAKEGHAEILSSLLRHGARCNDSDNDGVAPLAHAVFSRELLCVGMLLCAHGEGGPAQVNACDDGGWDALHVALFRKAHACATLLLSAGADVNHQTLSGVTALMRAAQNGDGAGVALLLSAGADPAIRDQGNRTAVDWARQAGFAELARTIEAEPARLARQALVLPETETEVMTGGPRL